MKLVYNIPATYNSGGMERVLANKANWLVRNGYDVSILTTDQMARRPFFDFDPRIQFYDLGINYEENNGKTGCPCGDSFRMEDGLMYCSRQLTVRREELRSWGCYYGCDDYKLINTGYKQLSFFEEQANEQT